MYNNIRKTVPDGRRVLVVELPSRNLQVLETLVEPVR